MHMPLSLVLGTQRQEIYEFEASLVYVVNSKSVMAMHKTLSQNKTNKNQPEREKRRKKT